MDHSLYDCMAYMIRELLDFVDDYFFQSYRALSKQTTTLNNKLLYEEFPDCLDVNGNVQKLSMPNQICEELAHRLRRFTDICIEENNPKLLTQMLVKLDLVLKDEVQSLKRDNCNFDVLNSNEKELDVQILPRCTSSWGHNSKDKNNSNTLNNFLSHMYYIDTREFRHRTGYEVSHCMLSCERFERAAEKHYLNIGTTPLGNGTKLELQMFESGDGTCQFKVIGISNEEELMTNVVKILNRAKELEIDIMCFPEMLGSEKIQDKIVEVLSDFPEENDKRSPVLTVCPTIWKDEENKAIVLDEYGEEILTQNKQKPYVHEDHGQFYKEALKQQKHIKVLHCDGIGRLAILICRDALERDFLQAVLEILKITLLIVPSFSTGYYDFSEDLKMCAAYDCSVIWINTCSAIPNDKRANNDKIGFVRKAGKKTIFRNGEHCYDFSECIRKQGGEECSKCIFTEKLYFEHIGCK